MTRRRVAVVLLCGGSADLTGWKERSFAFPQAATVDAAKADTDYAYQDHRQADWQLTLLPLRQGNPKRQHPAAVANALSRGRKRLGTPLIPLPAQGLRRIHAVLPAGFASKVLATFVAFAIIGAEKRNQ